MKENISNEELNEQSCKNDVSSSFLNGLRHNVYISDDLEGLKRSYTPEQFQKMWEDVYPKLSEVSGKVTIITDD